MRVRGLAQEHSTMSLARARTLSARSGVERTNHEATAPPLNAWVFISRFMAELVFEFQQKLQLQRGEVFKSGEVLRTAQNIAQGSLNITKSTVISFQ